MVREIGEQLWEIDSGEPGTALFILGGTHGNEETGVLLIEHLRAGFQSGRYVLVSGKVFLGIGNPRAVELGVRGVEGRDLNRYFTPAHLVRQVEGSETEQRAVVLARICDQADILIDIHSTNKPSIPFICSRIDAEHERLYRWFRYSTVLGDPNYVLAGEPATIDDYMNQSGKVALCAETGQASDTHCLPDTVQSVIALMQDLKILPGEPEIPPVVPEHTYALHTCLRRDDRPFSFAEGCGLRSFEVISAGDCIGSMGEENIYASVSGVIVFPKLPEHQGPGLPVGYVAVRVEQP